MLLQTPYLVLSQAGAAACSANCRQRAHPPRVIVSTNRLAATDAFIAYALSHKYKRRYLREFGFHIYEYKPFPADAPIDIAATGAAGDRPPPTPCELPPTTRPQATPRRAAAAARRARARAAREYIATRYLGRGANEPVPLKRAGVRIGLHAKSLVIDERVGVVGTHNFDPRGDHYNTESAVVIDDAAFAQALAASIRRDIAPGNSWVIAPRDKPPVLSGLEYKLGKLSEKLPMFDIWPLRYATSYEFVPGPGCPLPLPRDHPASAPATRRSAISPRSALGLKGLTTRMFTAFGAGLVPIL